MSKGNYVKRVCVLVRMLFCKVALNQKGSRFYVYFDCHEVFKRLGTTF